MALQFILYQVDTKEVSIIKASRLLKPQEGHNATISMYSNMDNGNERRKVADLTVGEFNSLISKIVSESFERVLAKVIPQRDPDEDVYWTTAQAAAFLGLTKQTIQARKKKGTIKYEGEGRTTRFTKAECKRHMREYGLPPASLMKSVENPVRVKYTRKKKKK